MDKCGGNKNWTRQHRTSDEYVQGVKDFVNSALLGSCDGNIYCPCTKCCNGYRLRPSEVEDHLMWNGIITAHTERDFQTQTVMENLDDSSFHINEELDIHDHDDVDELITDVFQAMNQDVNEIDSFGYSTPSLDDATGGSNVEAQRFFDLLSNENVKLWPECKFTRFSLVLRLFHIKCLSKWTNTSFTMLLEVLRDAIPNGKCLPKSYEETIKLIGKFGLSYEKIHACPNNCMLFRKEYASLDACPNCGASRWQVNESQTKKGKPIPVKVLCYFPIKPRLQRLFMSRETATLMRWHAEERINDGKLRHPADSEAWKIPDSLYPQFAIEPRNVRLGLSSNGFNPFGKLSSTYSIWPVVLTVYNLPPWLATKQYFLILSLIIPGPKSPRNDIDVYLQPLIDDLQELWEVGMNTFDASRGESFIMRAILLWGIHDFSGYGYLSGWKVHGKYGCPICNVDTCSIRLKHGGKFSFMGARRYKEPGHEFRYDAKSFDGTIEERLVPIPLSGTEILQQMEDIDFKSSHTWSNKSIFFTLPYWEFLPLRHNLDFMHIEKNVCENLVGTLLHIQGKTKDDVNARLDLQEMNIRERLWVDMSRSGIVLPAASYTMRPDERNVFFHVLHSIKVPDGYAGNISRWAGQGKMQGLKSHDWHILMEQLLPLALRQALPEHVRVVLFDLCGYFRELSSKVLKVDELEQLEARIVNTLCHMEMIFPPGFFTISVHLVLHLAREAKIGGPVFYRYMYFVERALGKLKTYVRNKARPEGSIAEGYLAEECTIFYSRYLKGLPTKMSRQSMHNGGRKGKPVILDENAIIQAHRYILFNYDGYCNKNVVSPFLRKHAIEIKRQNRRRCLPPNEIERIQNEQFHSWFRAHVSRLEEIGATEELSDEVKWLARGPNKIALRFKTFAINGYKFRTKDLDKKTQNSGVVVVAKTSSYASTSDVHPILGNITYYGRLTDILEFDYYGEKKFVLFKCEWADVAQGRGLKKDKFGFDLVNFSQLIHRGEKIHDEPYILAEQARQVFYVKDQQDPSWFVVVKVKPRDVIEIGDVILPEDVEIEPFHISLLEDTHDFIDEFRWFREDGVEIVVETI